ncbi:IclR family transcriptional regulator [Pseudonocardia benzenivorans]|uniref:Glycerol operon regulatory protein n=2 Tax=Pseudonocardia TaxID=1847 RepID=F4CQ16_PSEUX|nr:IclR family transcriptional regulator [Pseudonocardia dioxanivorans]AEA27212.1 transcriptional regulator, IclR family [Pseudonocardia dioxanivorans CB1190]GJF07164.1 IclR family transcriptional regulator [Pseudonocardia sp. D17]
MPGAIQSIERAAAALRLLASTGRPLALAELAAALDLPRPTAHGILRTLREVGFVQQDPGSALYTVGDGLSSLSTPGWDRHDLRSRSMNWADALAGGTGCAVFVGVPEGRVVSLVHHVFRPDGSPQRLRTNETVPMHATALGKCLLAFAPLVTPAARELDLHRYTGRTCTTPAALESHLAVARRRGVATSFAEHEPGIGGAAVPLRGAGGLAVGALAISGPVEHLFGSGGTVRTRLLDQLTAAAGEISVTLGHS